MICYRSLATTQHVDHFSHTSVRTKIRDGVDGYSTSSDFWLRCLYEGEHGDPADVEKGFLKSELLVKVYVLPISQFHSILTYCVDVQDHIYITILGGRRVRCARQPAQTTWERATKTTK